MFKRKMRSFHTLAPFCQARVVGLGQSAFSLIEVLVALLILSIGAMGISKMLLVSTTCHQQAQWREQVIVVGWSIADSLTVDQNEHALQAKTQYWQKKLDKILPGNVLTINRENVAGRNSYLIRISLATDVTKIFELRIYTS